ncbi:hypothetical protein K502DRAFT_327292 [Neoconidiobolus thromboides FSU 785]|nr:hypothetical protein K502DRAFT_327292 [Neoconidiobolus thromboides FSU 785]
MDSRSGIHSHVINPLMRYFFDAEESHKLSIIAAKYHLTPKEMVSDDEVMKVNIFGKEIKNPIGLAAGYDKNGEAIDAMFDLGFGLVEVGSVTPKPQEGNPKPRFFRLPEDKAVINRYGFNSDGHEEVQLRLKSRYWKHIKNINWEKDNIENEYNLPINKSGIEGKLLGINLGKNKTSTMESVDDYLTGVKDLGPYADYLVVNISSPNTPGLRELQKVSYFKELIGSVIKERDNLSSELPLLVKIAPDVNDQELKDIAQVALELKLDGIIVSNTTLARPSTLKTGKTSPKIVAEAGGLSGTPLKEKAIEKVSQLYKLTEGKIKIIGCGGISSGQDAIDFAMAGASLVQFYTHFGYRGPIAPLEIKQQAVEILKKNNTSWEKIVGQSHK